MSRQATARQVFVKTRSCPCLFCTHACTVYSAVVVVILLLLSLHCFHCAVVVVVVVVFMLQAMAPVAATLLMHMTPEVSL